nr:hypothetical protein [Tanacetum cinerariifolium]
ASTQVPPAGSNVATASISLDTAYGYQVEYGSSEHEGWQILEEDREKDFYLRECRAPRSQDNGRRDNYRQGSKVEEQAPKGLMAIDGVGWDWSFMGNEKENHALVTDEEAPTEFSMMAKTSAEIRGLELKVKFKTETIECLTNELKLLKKEKQGLDSKLTGFQSASKDLDNLLESQRSGKNKEGLGYNDVPPSRSSLLSFKKDMSSTRLPEFTDDTITDHSRPSPAIESTLHDL